MKLRYNIQNFCVTETQAIKHLRDMYVLRAVLSCRANSRNVWSSTLIAIIEKYIEKWMNIAAELRDG